VKPALLVLLAGAAVAAEERAFVEWEAPRDSYFVHEVIRLRLRLGYDRDFFRTNAVPLFRQPMDVPVHVRVPGTGPFEVEAVGGVRVALNDGVAGAAAVEDAVRDGRTYAVLEIELVHVPEEALRIAVPAPTLRYAYATRFEEDLIQGRLGTDPREVTVTGAPLALEVRPLPEEGRPREFDGAVGRFSVRAEVDRTSVNTAEILKLTLSIEGEGSMDSVSPPRLDLPGFHVYGRIDAQGKRSFTYDIAPVSVVTEVPPIPFAFFDPGVAAFRVVRTAPIPLDVRGAVAPRATGPWAAGLALLGALAGGLWWWRRARRRGPPPDPQAERARAAAAALGTAADLADAFAEFLAAHLRCPRAAVIAPDLEARLAAAGVPGDLARRAAATLERLVAARYGGEAPGRSGVDSLAREIEAAFRTMPSRPSP
jgi:hypothetical protein